MTKEDIIAKFHLFMDDTTDLSSEEESDLFDKVLDSIYSDRPWEFLKKEYTGTTSTSLPYIALPSDFRYLTANNNATDIETEASRPVVFVGSTYSPYEVVNYSDRRAYRNKDGFCYIDAVNNRLYFTLQPSSALAVEFDYCHMPEHLDLTEEPLMKEEYRHAIYHGMCVDDFIIQQSEKARSYAAENQMMFKKFMDAMAGYNANLQQI